MPPVSSSPPASPGPPGPSSGAPGPLPGPPGPSSAQPEPSPSPGPSPARPAARLVVRLTRDDVGARVTVRHRLHDDASASLTDVVGTLLAWDADDVLHVERRDGTVAAVPRADVVAAKVVPPPPPPR